MHQRCITSRQKASGHLLAPRRSSLVLFEGVARRGRPRIQTACGLPHYLFSPPSYSPCGMDQQRKAEGRRQLEGSVIREGKGNEDTKRPYLQRLPLLSSLFFWYFSVLLFVFVCLLCLRVCACLRFHLFIYIYIYIFSFFPFQSSRLDLGGHLYVSLVFLSHSVSLSLTVTPSKHPPTTQQTHTQTSGLFPWKLTSTESILASAWKLEAVWRLPAKSQPVIDPSAHGGQLTAQTYTRPRTHTHTLILWLP